MEERFKVYLPKAIDGRDLSRILESICKELPRDYICIIRTLLQAKPHETNNKVIEEYKKKIIVTENLSLIERIRRFLGHHDTFEMSFLIDCNKHYDQLFISGVKSIDKYVCAKKEENISSMFTGATEGHLNIIELIVEKLYNKLRHK